MSKKLMSVAALVLAATFAHASAYADEPAKPVFSFSGFGTFGVVHSSEKNADFTTSSFKPNGSGSSHAWSADVDSLIAGQLTAAPTAQLSAVLQVIAEQNYDNSYVPHVEWANAKYQFSPDFSVRVGRTVVPVFLISDTRKVGYTYPWVRPPIEVYQVVPVTHNDGIDASHSLHLGELTNTLQMNWGKGDSKIPNGGGIARTRGSWTAADTIEDGPLTVHFSYGRGHLALASLDSLFAAFAQFGPEGISIADKYATGAKALSFVAVGAMYDPGAWFVTGEWGQLRTDSSIGRRTVWYASGGYRAGSFTPYLTYAHADADNLSDPGLTVSSLPPSLAGPAAGLNAALNSILRGKPVQNTISVGARWDVAKNTAVKLQFDRTHIGASSNGTLINIQPGFQTGSRLSVLSATVDFIF
jgi:hypothetical protein